MEYFSIPQDRILIKEAEEVFGDDLDEFFNRDEYAIGLIECVPTSATWICDAIKACETKLAEEAIAEATRKLEELKSATSKK